MKTPRSILMLVLAGLGFSAAAEDTWNQWRGPNRDGRAEMFGSLPAWPEAPSKAWEVEVGTGHASPVVDSARVYLFSRAGGDEVAAAYDLAGGNPVWSQRYPVSFKARMGGGHHGAGPKSTPAVASGRLVTFGITGILSCFDAATGEQLWRLDFAEEQEEPFPRWGTSLSPLIDGGRVFVHFGGERGAVVALDAATGEEIWRHEGRGASYASPVLGELGGHRQLVTMGSGGLLALDLDGKTLWDYSFPTSYVRQNIASPVLIGGQVIITGKKRPTTALRPQSAGGTWRVEVAWKRDDLPMDMSTAVPHRDRLCGLTHLKKGQAFCVDGGGADVWIGAPRFAEHASVVATPDAVLYLLAGGTLVAVDASGSAYRELARYNLADSETWAHPAVIEAGLLIKSLDRLARFDFRP